MKKIFTIISFFFCFYETHGQVGIGTTTPKAGLHVADSSVVFSAAGFIDSKGTLPISGEGRRFFWYPGKAAFRSGFVNGTQWDKNNIGDYSFAVGFSTTASGNMSTSMGSYSKASGYLATAMGYATNSTGFYTTTMGDETAASGIVATAMGQETVATGNYSTSTGQQTTASGHYSFAMGELTNAAGDHSVASGFLTNAKGDNSVAMGTNTSADSYLETVLGQYNATDNAANGTEWVALNKLFTIGNGTSATDKKDALTVLKNGNTGIGIPAPSQKLDVAGNVKSSGLILATTGGTASTLSHYEESSHSAKLYNGPVTYIASYSINIVRVGKLVTISFPNDILSLTVTVNDIVFSGLPARFCPATNQYFPIRTVNGGTLQMGLAFVQTNGNIYFKPNPAGSNWDGANSGFYATSVSYFIN